MVAASSHRVMTDGASLRRTRPSLFSLKFNFKQGKGIKCLVENLMRQ